MDLRAEASSRLLGIFRIDNLGNNVSIVSILISSTFDEFNSSNCDNRGNDLISPNEFSEISNVYL
jgi:hypothetical protein